MIPSVEISNDKDFVLVEFFQSRFQTLIGILAMQTGDEYKDNPNCAGKYAPYFQILILVFCSNKIMEF